VVVTGAAGFIGRHLVARLAREGRRVRALDVNPAPELDLEGVEWHRGDVRDREALGSAFLGADVVFHLASAHLQHRVPSDFYRSVNVDGALAVVEAAAEAGVRRVVHTGTVGIYGHVESPPAREDAPRHPTNEYERTKRRGEEAALGRAEELGLDLVVLRPGWVYGPGCPRTSKLLGAVGKGRFLFVGDGSNLRHPIHVSEVVDAFLLAAEAPEEVAGRDYLIVGPEAVSVRDLAAACARVQGVRPPRLRVPRGLFLIGALGAELGFALLGRDPPVSRRTLAFFENDNAFSGERAARELGFRPRIGVEEGLRATLDGVEPVSREAPV
jgi:nucleoside-diphosphate-sugar epimerase